MTPNARYAAAIGILDAVLTGTPAEKTLTNWARSNRYAGSKDRAAVRDIVFDCLRQKRSFMHMVGLDGARGLIAGHIMAAGLAVKDVFTGERFAAEALSDNELAQLKQIKEAPLDTVRLDIPDWLEPELRASLGDDFETSLSASPSRAPLDLRVNRNKASLENVRTELLKDGIETETINTMQNALRVTANPRRVALSAAYLNGWVEIQDAGSQSVVDALSFERVKTVLDYCAGGGGKTLAMAALADDGTRFDTYDQNKARMNDLPARAKRAGVPVKILQTDPVLLGKTYDLVLLDVPCSGTGAWRRNPDGKWRFNDADLQDLLNTQANILINAHKLVASDGTLVYVTCSLLRQENENQVDTFLSRHKDWVEIRSTHIHPSGGTDGFFVALLKKIQL